MRQAMSKYDYRDPGTDPAYCDGLATENDERLTDESTADMDVCAWCNEPYTNREYYPYCSSQCGLYAERDDRPPRTLTRQEGRIVPPRSMHHILGCACLACRVL